MSDLFGKKHRPIKICERNDDSWKMKVWFGKDPSTSRIFTPNGEELTSVMKMSIEQDANTLSTLLHLTILEPVVLSEEPPASVEVDDSQLEFNLGSIEEQKEQLMEAVKEHERVVTSSKSTV